MPTYENNPIEKCEALLQEMEEKPNYITYDGDKAFYSPGKDSLKIPDLRYFKQTEAFYCTLFHELTHWTGAAHRLAREDITKPTKFGTNTYAEEELIAEMGASYLCAITGIDQEKITENSAAYIQDWMKRFQNDNKLIFRIASQAQKAADYITGRKPTAV